jgi:hypothetical protein
MDKGSENETGLVMDMNARPGETRIHEIIIKEIDGGEPITKMYRLNSETPVEMPMDHALKFLSDKAFVVTSKGGDLIKPVKRRDPSQPVVKLEADEVIAEYSELSRDALWKRAKVLPGSDKIGKASSNETLIEFIKAKTADQPGTARGSEGIIPEENVSDFMQDSPLLAKKAA